MQLSLPSFSLSSSRFTHLPLVLSVFALPFSGCLLGQACDLIAVASVNVTTVDDSGAAVQVPGLEYRAAGDDGFQAATCNDGSEDACSDWTAGYELAGDIEIQVTDCPESAVSVTVGEDECHVITESLDLTVPAACLAAP
jgi:hypothetical protein